MYQQQILVCMPGELSYHLSIVSLENCSSTCVFDRGPIQKEAFTLEEK